MKRPYNKTNNINYLLSVFISEINCLCFQLFLRSNFLFSFPCALLSYFSFTFFPCPLNYQIPGLLFSLLFFSFIPAPYSTLFCSPYSILFFVFVFSSFASPFKPSFPFMFYFPIPLFPSHIMSCLTHSDFSSYLLLSFLPLIPLQPLLLPFSLNKVSCLFFLLVR